MRVKNLEKPRGERERERERKRQKKIENECKR